MRRRRAAAILALAAAVALGAIGVPIASAAAASPAPKVVVIVGPVGSLTDYYRSLASEAVAAARAANADVVPLFSPDATWPAVARALQGASIVVYLGHGYGHPSPYRSTLDMRSQDGMGLNPVAGVDDLAHEYFGEHYIATDVRLAPGAVVVLSHLCYASGNPEPGGPDPTLPVAEARVDNFAAGWLAAGAGAVVAEGYLGPAYYVRSLLAGDRAITSIWQHAPTFHDHVTAFGSTRTRGASDYVDPVADGSGYFRSLVVARSAGGTPLPATARQQPTQSGQPAGRPVPAPPLSLAARGMTVGSPVISDSPVAGRAMNIALPISLPAGVHLPAGIQVGGSWSLLVADPLAADPLAAVPAAAPAAPSPPSSFDPASSPPPQPMATPGPPGSPEPSSSPLATAAQPAAFGGAGLGPPVPPPTVDLIAAEASGVVTLLPTQYRSGLLEAAATPPLRPGWYRFTLTLHGRDGVPLDAAVQGLVQPLDLHVMGSLSATYGVEPQALATANGQLNLGVRVTNTGTVPWDGDVPAAPPAPDAAIAAVPMLVGRWVSLGLPMDPLDPAGAPGSVPTVLAPGTSADLDLLMDVPSLPGDYLVLLDIQTPGHGSLAAAGVPFGVVHVLVQPARPPDPGQAPT